MLRSAKGRLIQGAEDAQLDREEGGQPLPDSQHKHSRRDTSADCSTKSLDSVAERNQAASVGTQIVAGRARAAVPEQLIRQICWLD